MTDHSPPSFVRRSIAREVTDPQVLVGLCCDESYWVRRQAVGNPATPAWIIDLLVRAGALPDLRGSGPIDPSLGADELRTLVECGPWAQRLVAEHPNTPADVLAVLAQQHSVVLRRAVADHPLTPPVAVRALSADTDEDVRARAWARADHPAELIAAMRALDDGRPVDPQRLADVATAGPWGTFAAARRAGCPVEIVRAAATDADWRVRSGVLDNPETPLSVLDQVVGDGGAVAPLADPAAGGDALAGLARHPAPEARLAVVRHRAVTKAALGVLLTDHEADIRRVAARHPRAPADELDLLIRAGSTPDLTGLAEPGGDLNAADLDALVDRGGWGRQLAVRHPSAGPRILARLLCDASGKIREWAAVHPNVDPEDLQDLHRAGAGDDLQGVRPPDPTLSTARLRWVAELGPWGKWVVAANIHTPPELLAELADEGDVDINRILAGNPAFDGAV